MSDQPVNQSNSEFPRATVELIRAKAHNSGAFRLKDAGLLRDGIGKSSHLTNPLDGGLIPVPYGSLENYARHLAGEWGDENIYVKFVITIQHCETAEPPHAPDFDDTDRRTQEYLNSLPASERAKIQRLPILESPDTVSPDAGSTS